MKNFKSIFGIILSMAFLIVISSSCQQEPVYYQTKVRNSCQIYVLGTSIPFMKYEIVDFTVGDESSGPVSYNSDSEYFTVQSEMDYLISMTYDVYFYDIETFTWEYDRRVTQDMGTESWTRTEDADKFIMKVEIGDILMSYDPYFETYIAN